MNDCELGYIAALIDLHGYVGVLFDRQTRHYNPYLRIVGKRSQLLRISQRLRVFNGPYDINDRWAYLTIRKVHLLREVLTDVSPHLILKTENVRKVLPFVNYRADNLYTRNKLAELQLLREVIG